MGASGYTQAFSSVTGFWLEGARSSEEAELVSPQSALFVPLEFVVPACNKSAFATVLLNLHWLGLHSHWEI